MRLPSRPRPIIISALIKFIMSQLVRESGEPLQQVDISGDFARGDKSRGGEDSPMSDQPIEQVSEHLTPVFSSHYRV